MEGFSDDFLIFACVCVLSIGCGYILDKTFLSRRFPAIPSNNSPGIAPAASPRSRGVGPDPRHSSERQASPRTEAGFSETQIALEQGELPQCPICLDQVANAVETSW